MDNPSLPGMNRGLKTLTMAQPGKEGVISMAIDFTVKDAAGKDWTLSEHLDAAAVITFHRGDF